MNRSSSLRRVVLVLCVMVVALAAIVAQMVVPQELPTLAASWQGGVSRFSKHAHDARVRLASLVQSTDRDALQEQVRSRLPSLPAISSPEREVRTAWRRAQQAGAYHFTTRIVQTTHPAPAIANVGTGSRVETLFIEGKADLLDQALFMRLWHDGGSIVRPDNALEVRVEGDKAYGRVGNGRWESIDNFAATIAPGNDALGFLAGVRNVHPLERLTPEIQRYRFDLDGPAFADYMLSLIHI